MLNSAQHKIARINWDLAPEDDTYGQAAHTAVLRDDPDYTRRWIRLHIHDITQGAHCLVCGVEWVKDPEPLNSATLAHLDDCEYLEVLKEAR